MHVISAWLKKELSPQRILAGLVITGLAAGILRLFAWLAQVPLVSELAYWVLVPISLFALVLITTMVLGPYLGPRISTAIQWLSFGTNAEQKTLAFLVVLARNTGTASTIDAWNASVFPVGGSEVVGQRVAFTKPANVTVGSHVQEFSPQDWIVNKGIEDPVPRGGRIMGVLIIQFDGVAQKDLARPGTRIEVTCSDCFGRKYHCEHVWTTSNVGQPPVLSGLASPPPKTVGT